MESLDIHNNRSHCSVFALSLVQPSVLVQRYCDEQELCNYGTILYCVIQSLERDCWCLLNGCFHVCVI